MPIALRRRSSWAGCRGSYSRWSSFTWCSYRLFIVRYIRNTKYVCVCVCDILTNFTVLFQFHSNRSRIRIIQIWIAISKKWWMIFKQQFWSSTISKSSLKKIFHFRSSENNQYYVQIIQKQTFSSANKTNKYKILL